MRTFFLPGSGPKAGFSSARVARIVKKTLRSEKKTQKGEINVIFVGTKKIRSLNRKFLNEKGSTDVIAFPRCHPGMSQSRIQVKMGPGLKISRATVSGDIYICLPVARANAKRFDEPVGREMTRLVVHGALHLLGYADEPASARKRMWARQEPIVEALWKH